MLLVRTRLAPSPTHGIGLFAAEPIPRGAPVWRFEPGLDLEIEPGRVDALPAAAREALLHYAYLDPRTGLYVLCWDDARFMNHADDPNTRTDPALDPPRGADVAARDIAAGEELTCDYRTFEADPGRFLGAGAAAASPAWASAE